MEHADSTLRATSLPRCHRFPHAGRRLTSRLADCHRVEVGPVMHAQALPSCRLCGSKIPSRAPVYVHSRARRTHQKFPVLRIRPTFSEIQPITWQAYCPPQMHLPVHVSGIGDARTSFQVSAGRMEIIQRLLPIPNAIESRV